MGVRLAKDFQKLERRMTKVLKYQERLKDQASYNQSTIETSEMLDLRTELCGLK